MSGTIFKGSILRKFLSKNCLKTSRLTRQTPVQSLVILRTYYTVKRKAQKDEQFLSKHLFSKIKASGPITVADYMREVLQNPTRGYYMTKDVFGATGDFITSPEISQIFGEMIAVWFLNEWQKIGSPKPLQIVELGPGRGTLSADILKVFDHFKALHKSSLHLVEISPTLSDIQSRTLCIQSNLTHDTSSSVYRQGIAHQGIPVMWYKDFKDVPEGFSLILAHEFFDALPIHKFHKTYAGYKEVLVDLEKVEFSDIIKFRYVLARQDTPMVNVLIKPTETREHLEVSPTALLLYEVLCKRIVKNGGIALICDYGHDGDGTDTFRAFKKHKQVDPLLEPGTADLTADVDFNLIRDAANKNGDVLFFGPVKQRTFLHKVGIEYRVEALKNSMNDKRQIENLMECYQFLTDENKMGERFKFCTLMPATVRKIIDKYPVVGFA